MLKKLILGLVGLIVILLIVAYILPAEYKVERRVVIDTKAEHIFPQVNHLEHWKAWMAWIRKEPDMKITFTGPAEGVGATMSWESKDGNGSLTIDDSVPNQHIYYTLTFAGWPPSKGRMILKSLGDSTEVSWSDEGNLGMNPVSRYFGLVLDSMMGPDFEAGLNNLKEVSEKAASDAAAEAYDAHSTEEPDQSDEPEESEETEGQ